MSLKCEPSAGLLTTMGGVPGLLAIALLAEAIGFYRSGWFFTIGCTPLVPRRFKFVPGRFKFVPRIIDL